MYLQLLAAALLVASASQSKPAKRNLVIISEPCLFSEYSDKCTAYGMQRAVVSKADYPAIMKQLENVAGGRVWVGGENGVLDPQEQITPRFAKIEGTGDRAYVKIVHPLQITATSQKMKLQPLCQFVDAGINVEREGWVRSESVDQNENDEQRITQDNEDSEDTAEFTPEEKTGMSSEKREKQYVEPKVVVKQIELKQESKIGDPEATDKTYASEQEEAVDEKIEKKKEPKEKIKTKQHSINQTETTPQLGKPKILKSKKHSSVVPIVPEFNGTLSKALHGTCSENKGENCPGASHDSKLASKKTVAPETNSTFGAKSSSSDDSITNSDSDDSSDDGTSLLDERKKKLVKFTAKDKAALKESPKDVQLFYEKTFQGDSWSLKNLKDLKLADGNSSSSRSTQQSNTTHDYLDVDKVKVTVEDADGKFVATGPADSKVYPIASLNQKPAKKHHQKKEYNQEQEFQIVSKKESRGKPVQSKKHKRDEKTTESFEEWSEDEVPTSQPKYIKSQNTILNQTHTNLPNFSAAPSMFEDTLEKSANQPRLSTSGYSKNLALEEKEEADFSAALTNVFGPPTLGKSTVQFEEMKQSGSLGQSEQKRTQTPPNYQASANSSFLVSTTSSQSGVSSQPLPLQNSSSSNLSQSVSPQKLQTVTKQD